MYTPPDKTDSHFVPPCAAELREAIMVYSGRISREIRSVFV